MCPDGEHKTSHDKLIKWRGGLAPDKPRKQLGNRHEQRPRNAGHRKSVGKDSRRFQLQRALGRSGCRSSRDRSESGVARGRGRCAPPCESRPVLFRAEALTGPSRLAAKVAEECSYGRAQIFFALSNK